MLTTHREAPANIDMSTGCLSQLERFLRMGSAKLVLSTSNGDLFTREQSLQSTTDKMIATQEKRLPQYMRLRMCGASIPKTTASSPQWMNIVR